MKRWKWIVAAVACIVLAGGILVYAKDAGDSTTSAATAEKASESSEEGPVAQVETVPLRRGTIHETLHVYGTVAAAPGETHTFSIPFECKVIAIQVTGGEVVKKGASLVDVEAGPDARLQLEDAKAEGDASATDLEEIQKRYDLKLATQQDLLDARRRLEIAKAHLKDLEARGIATLKVVKADADGVVSHIDVQPGRTVPADTPLVETVNETGIAVRVGIESERISRLKTGDVVKLAPLGGSDSSPLKGRIRLITRQVNPETHLVDVFIQPDPGAHLLLNDSVRVTLTVASSDGLIVPRSAVLPDESHFQIFTVSDNKAVDHTVEVGLENGDSIEVSGTGLKVGDPVVVMGNSEIQDGMTVEVGKAR